MRKLSLAITALGAVALCAAALADAATQPPADLPKSLEPNFKTFATKCSQCHNPERVYTSKYTDEKSLTALVSRMSRKPGAGISRDDQKKIVAYLTWRANHAKS